MTTSERLRTMQACEARNNAAISSHASDKAVIRAAALDKVRSSVDPMITPELAGEVIGCNPQYIRVSARSNPGALGFPVIITGKRTHIPRAAFLRYVDGGIL